MKLLNTITERSEREYGLNGKVREEDFMSKQKETYVYSSLAERFKLEWKIFALAFVFILIADNIGQVKIPVGKGMFILFPIFMPLFWVWPAGSGAEIS